MKERIHWIDWSKCILIYLVVVAHYGQIPTLVDNLICAFHMPAFFMISGYLHKSIPTSHSIVKNFKRLIIPALLFSLLCWIYHSMIMFLKQVPFTVEENLIKPLLGIIRYDRPNVAPPCGVIWFLQVLFICQVLLDYLTRRGLKNILCVCLICVIATWIWYYIGIDDRCYLFFLQRTCASFPFVAIGYVVKEKLFMQKFSNINWLPWLLLIIYLLGVLYNGRVGIYSWSFGYDVVLFYFIAITACFSFFLFINKIKIGGGKILITISNGTIVILCLHRLMIPILQKLHIDAFIGSILILIICYPLILLFQKHFPWFIGSFKK